MKEDKQYAERTNKPDGKQEQRKEALTMRAPIGELVMGDLSGYVPTHEETSQDGTCGQHEVGCQGIAEVHHGESEQLQTVHSTYGQ